MKEIDGDKAYPIYSFIAKWVDDIPKDTPDIYKDYPNWTKDLPKGRFHNSTSFSQIHEKEKSQEFLDNYIKEWWEKYKVNKKLLNPYEPKLSVKFHEFETWHLTWFMHETFRNKMSNKKALQSFERYVSRKEVEVNNSKDKNGLETKTLMGAEDRYRWRGKGYDDKAPCLCEGCAKSGMVRINH